jgi:hypothetical protein
LTGAKSEGPVFRDGARAPKSDLSAEAPAVAARRTLSRRANAPD